MSIPGIIPALAGNTIPPGHRPRQIPDHPRSRGEYHNQRGIIIPMGGSSPLSRGIRRGWYPGGVDRRIIPALAGNTRHPSSDLQRSRDHPRSRGEYGRRRSPAQPGLGSSPLSRGIRSYRYRMIDRLRIIPALAGNTRQAAEWAGSG